MKRVLKTGKGEIVEKKSRFISIALNVDSPQQALDYVNSIKTLYPQANIGSISSGNFGSRELSNIIIFEHKFKPMIKNFDIYQELNDCCTDST